jgi:hypothetical protein
VLAPFGAVAPKTLLAPPRPRPLVALCCGPCSAPDGSGRFRRRHRHRHRHRHRRHPYCRKTQSTAAGCRGCAAPVSGQDCHCAAGGSVGSPETETSAGGGDGPGRPGSLVRREL